MHILSTHMLPRTVGGGTMFADLLLCRMNRRKADFKFAYKFLEDDL